MAERIDRIGDKKKRALSALLAEPTIRAAARAAGLSEETLYRYMRDPSFRAAIVQAQGAMLDAAAGRLTGLLGKALDVIGENFETEAEPSAKLSAAGLVLRHITGLLAFADLERRVEALEERERNK